jgi:hypothetical protein
VNQLSKEFGGIYIHSCGNWTHQFPSLDKVHRLRGLEFGASEAPYQDVIRHFGGKIPLACRVGLNQQIKFQGMVDYVTSILNSSKTTRGLFINVDITNGITGEDWPVTDLHEIYQLMRLNTNVKSPA